MSLDENVRAEVLSFLVGQDVKPYDSSAPKPLLSVPEYHLRTILGSPQPHPGFAIEDKSFFDPQYDYDFTSLTDSSQCQRGDEPYKRPKGWYRMALKVKGKYPDGDTWLGKNEWRSYSTPGEWPVSYHGSSYDGAKGIVREYYKAGERMRYGRGIYSTPDLQVAEAYAKSFTSQTNGKTYKVVVQNRINPKERVICKGQENYWLISIPKGTSEENEKKIVEKSLRPYGILIKDLNAEPSSQWWWWCNIS